MRSAAAVAALGLVLLAGAVGAAARNVTGSAAAERLRGTNGSDFILGRGGRDQVLARGGADRISIEHDGASDVVSCGSGTDVVTADARDGVAPDCEVVSRGLSRDPYRNGGAQHQTEVEPDSFASGSTVVATFQVGRFHQGGANNIGFATSRDAGRSWRSGLLPGITTFSRPRGPAERVSDPAVAYDAVHRRWLIASLAILPRETRLFVNRSTDGRRWGRPVTASAAAPTNSSEGIAFDKEWIACDNGARSPFRGHCYLAYSDLVGRDEIVTRTSTDGGAHWSAPVVVDAGEIVGAFPVTRPNGDLVVLLSNGNAMVAGRSTDGGASFAAPVRFATHRTAKLDPLRAFELPSVDVDRAGTLYATWHDCRFRSGCSSDDVVLATSPDGVSWSDPVRVPLGPVSSSRAFVLPGIGVDPSASGAARLAIVYYTMASLPCRSCAIDAGLVRSSDGGRTWSAPRRLSARSMRPTWLADTVSGRMLADYISVSWSRGRAVPVFALASEPRGRSFREAIFATTRLR
jgi:hypothetical protein